jgi:hypothetical protein
MKLLKKLESFLFFANPKKPNIFRRMAQIGENRIPIDFEPIRTHLFAVDFFETIPCPGNGIQKITKKENSIELEFIVFIGPNIHALVVPGFIFELQVELMDPCGEPIYDYIPRAKYKVISKKDPVLSYDSSDLFKFTIEIKEYKETKIQSLKRMFQSFLHQLK